MWRQSVLLAVSSFRMEAMAAEGFASGVSVAADTADLSYNWSGGSADPFYDIQ